MSDDTNQFIVIGDREQASIHDHMAARQCERVGNLTLHDVKLEFISVWHHAQQRRVV